jgi:hypothetical protein
MSDEYAADEKRQHPRFPLAQTAFIELLAADVGSEDESAGEVVSCRTVNASRAGLQVKVRHPLIVGSMLQVAVDMADDDSSTLYLVAEVRWCELGPISGQGWIAGFILMDALDSDIDAWHSLLTKMAS